MICGYSTIFPWKEPTEFEYKIQNWIKRTTIRVDATRRWEVGSVMHCCTGVRTKNYECFALAVVTKIDYIYINPVYKQVFGSHYDISNCVGWKSALKKRAFQQFPVYKKQVARVAMLDGFDSVGDFWRWFNTPFDGVRLHFKVYA